jgi:hypothetical protein
VAPTRYRCAACGNLTRFDVVTDRRTRAFHHYSVGGELGVEDEVVLSEDVVEVSCRWCGHGRAVEVLEVLEDGEAAAAGPEGTGGEGDPLSQPSGRVSASTADGEPSER